MCLRRFVSCFVCNSSFREDTVVPAMCSFLRQSDFRGKAIVPAPLLLFKTVIRGHTAVPEPFLFQISFSRRYGCACVVFVSNPVLQKHVVVPELLFCCKSVFREILL